MQSPTRLNLVAIGIVVGWVLLAALACAGTRNEPAPILCKPSGFPTTGKIDSPAPESGTRGFDVLAYDLELRLDPAAHSVSGQVDIRFRAETDLTVVRLDLVPELTVTSIRDHTGPLDLTREDEHMEIRLRDALPPGAVDSLTINWSGRPPRHGSFGAGLMFRVHDAGTREDPTDDVPVVANVSETWSAHSWWPCKDHPSDKAYVSLAVTVPDTLSAVSNGTLVSVATTEPGWRRYEWRENFPLATYLVSVAVSDYESWSEDCRPAVGPPVRLDYHVFPADRADAEYDLANTCEMMSFLTELLGPWPFPHEKYAQVEFVWIGAMEHTTASSLAQLLFTGDRHFENVFVHELVHQWFGDSLTPALWADVWLNEGFARYGEALWIEYRDGPAAYAQYMRRIGPLNHPDLFRGEGVLSDPVPILPNSLVYDKGAWVLHMLRGMLGDDTFFAFLRAYATAPPLRHGIVTVADMISVAEVAAGSSLAMFFEPWLTTDQVPVVSHLVTTTPSGGLTLTLAQHQSPDFQLPVPVVIHTACGDMPVTARLTEVRQNFRWQVGCQVDSVSIAPDGLALMRGLASPPAPLAVRGPAPNPASADGTGFMLFLTAGSQVTVSTYDVGGRKLGTESLGFLTATGPSELPQAPGHAWHWSAAGADEHPLPSGLYYLEFKSARGRQVHRITLVR